MLFLQRNDYRAIPRLRLCCPQWRQRVTDFRNERPSPPPIFLSRVGRGVGPGVAVGPTVATGRAGGASVGTDLVGVTVPGGLGASVTGGCRPGDVGAVVASPLVGATVGSCRLKTEDLVSLFSESSPSSESSWPEPDCCTAEERSAGGCGSSSGSPDPQATSATTNRLAIIKNKHLY